MSCAARVGRGGHGLAVLERAKLRQPKTIWPYSSFRLVCRSEVTPKGIDFLTPKSLADSLRWDRSLRPGC